MTINQKECRQVKGFAKRGLKELEGFVKRVENLESLPVSREMIPRIQLYLSECVDPYIATIAENWKTNRHIYRMYSHRPIRDFVRKHTFADPVFNQVRKTAAFKIALLYFYDNALPIPVEVWYTLKVKLDAAVRRQSDAIGNLIDFCENIIYLREHGRI